MSQDEIVTILSQCSHWWCMSDRQKKDAVNYYRNTLELEERKIVEQDMPIAA